MEKEYKLKGIEKILEKTSKEELAKTYNTSVDDDFEKILTDYFCRMGIPNNSEIAIYASLTPEEYRKRREEKKSIDPQELASEFLESDVRKRALYGINFIIEHPQYDKDYNQLVSGNYGNIVYFAIDEPMKESDFQNMFCTPRYFVGGTHYNGLIMGSKYFEEHESELNKALPNNDKSKAVESYIKNFVNEFNDVEFTGGYGSRGKYNETEKIINEKEKNEKIILELTGKSSIDELSLKDFIQLKRTLEKEEKELQKAFTDKFTTKENEERN